MLYSEGVAKGRLSICELVRLLCANPSRLYGLYPRKGTLQPGADADVVILDPAKRRTLTHAGLHSAVDYTCYEGMEPRGPLTWCSPAEKWRPGTTSSWASGALDATSGGATAAWPNKYKTSAASKAGGALARMRARKTPARRAGVWDTRQRSHFSMRARSWSANRPRSLLVPPLLWAMTSMSLRPTSSRRW